MDRVFKHSNGEATSSYCKLLNGKLDSITLNERLAVLDSVIKGKTINPVILLTSILLIFVSLPLAVIYSLVFRSEDIIWMASLPFVCVLFMIAVSLLWKAYERIKRNKLKKAVEAILSSFNNDLDSFRGIRWEIKEPERKERKARPLNECTICVFNKEFY